MIRVADAQTRSRHVADLYALIAECVRDAPTSYWLDKLKSADIPSGPVNPLAALPADEHLAAVDMFPKVEHRTEGSIRIVRPPVKFSSADWRSVAPRRTWASTRARSCARRGLPMTKSQICSLAR